MASATGDLAVVTVSERINPATNTRVFREKYLRKHHSRKGFAVVDNDTASGLNGGYKWFPSEKLAREYMAEFGEVTDL